MFGSDLAILIPTLRLVDYRVVICLMGLECPIGMSRDIMLADDSTARKGPAATRNDLIALAVKEYNPQRFLFLDDDTLFPRDLVLRMWGHMERGEKIVSGVVPMRGDTGHSALIPEGEKIARQTWDIGETFYLEAVGAACLMVGREVIDAMPSGEWFKQSAEQDEGVYFCHAARRLGYRILCDTRLQCGHADRRTGKVTYTPQEFERRKRETSEPSMEVTKRGA